MNLSDVEYVLTFNEGVSLFYGCFYACFQRVSLETRLCGHGITDPDFKNFDKTKMYYPNFEALRDHIKAV
jgi:hypothetical protein